MKPIAHAVVSSLLCASALAQETARPRITGVARVRLYATNLEKSRDFYAKILGLGPAKAGCGGDAPCFAVNDHQVVTLLPAPAPPPANLLAEVAFATPDVGAMQRYLLAHQVSAGAVAKDADGTQHFELKDPEGNPIAFVQQPPPRGWSAPTEQVSRRLVHAGFIVRDAKAADRFYRDLLGFRMYWHGGMKETDVDWLEIQVPDGQDWIEYMLNIDPKADHDERGVMNHFALGVTTLKPAVLRLRAHGLKSDAEPEIGRDGKWQFDIFDPDATRVEFMEFKPAQAPCCHPYEGPHASE